VKLHILYDAGKADQTGGSSTTVDPKIGTAKAIIDAGLKPFAHPVHDKSGQIMHNKFIVRDGASVWTGSGNFTNGGLLLQDNNFLTIDSPALAAAYLKTFGDLAAPGHSVSHAQGTPGTPTTVKVGGIRFTIFFSTQVVEGEPIEDAVRGHLKNAKKVRVMSMLVSDPGILTSLQALKSKDIKGIVDPHMMKNVMRKKAGQPQFWFANGDPRFVAAPSHAFIKTGDKNDFMHNKVLIIDDRVVVTGSYNLSENAEMNDENMLIIESPTVAAAYTRYFNALFAQYKKHGAPLPPV
jgi:hypothetical protein